MAQLTFLDVGPAMEMVQLAEDVLRDYVWMPGEIARRDRRAWTASPTGSRRRAQTW